MKRIISILILIFIMVVVASTATAAPPKYKDDPSVWSLQTGPDSYIVFRFPQRIFLCPFTELSGSVASRFGGKCFHWMEVAHPLSRGTNCHYWAEIIEPDGKLGEQAQSFLDNSQMNTAYNEATFKVKKVEKTAVLGKIPAYTATYKTKLLSTAAKVSFEASGQFWIFDHGKSRVVIQADAFRENYDCVPTLLKSMSTGKNPLFTDLKIAQTATTTYRYISMPMPLAPAILLQVPDGSLASWSVTDPIGNEVGSIRLRQTFLGDITLESWKESLLSNLRSRNIEKPEDLVKVVKVGDRDAFSIEFPTATDDDKHRDSHVRNLCFVDGGYVVEFYAISYDKDKTKAGPVWSLIEKSIAGLMVWTAN